MRAPMCHISNSFASTIITNHEHPPSATAPNSLEMLQKRAQEVLDSASQGLLSGNLVDELAFRKEKLAGLDGVHSENLFKHRCRYCGKVFGSDSALQIHIRSHTGERPFHCHVCGSRFTTKGNLKVHYQRHTQTFSYLQMNNAMMPDPVSEQQFHPGMRYPAPIPPSNEPPMKYQKSIEQMKRLVGDKNLEQFNDVVQQEEPADLRKSASSPSVSQNNERRFSPLTIPSLTKETHSKFALQNAIESSDGEDQEEAENLSKMARQSPYSDQDAVPLKQINPVRRSETSKLQSLVDNIENNISDSMQCPVCFKTLPCWKTMQVHLQTHSDEGPFKCNICGRTFGTIEHLKIHLSAHNLQSEARSPYQCPVCNKHFTNESYLVEHIKVHSIRIHSSDATHSDDDLNDDAGENEDDEDIVRQPSSEPVSLVNCIKKRSNTPSTVSSSPETLQSISESSAALDLTPKSHKQITPSMQQMHNMQHSAIGIFPNFPFLPAQSPITSASPLSSLTQSVMPAGPFNPLGLSGMSSIAAAANASSCHNLLMNVDQGYHFLNDLVPGIRGNTTCNICFKTFACHSALEIHYRSHTKERPFKCSVCERGFSTKVSSVNNVFFFIYV